MKTEIAIIGGANLQDWRQQLQPERQGTRYILIIERDNELGGIFESVHKHNGFDRIHF